MDQKEKEEKKKFISKNINLANGRYKDSEIDFLHEISTNIDKYNGKTKAIKKEIRGWSSDGKFVRQEETTYSIKADGKGLYIEEKYKYQDDDGMCGDSSIEYRTGRKIIDILKTKF